MKDIEAIVTVHESAAPQFHKACLVPFTLKEKVEKQLQQQVQEGELMLVDSSDWATPIVVVHKKVGVSGFAAISRFLLSLFCSLRHTPCLPQRDV